jgi:hypothetical protein
LLPYIIGFFLILGALAPLIEIFTDGLSGGRDVGLHDSHSEFENDDE